MKQENVTNNIFTFEELPEETQEKIIEKWRENNLDYEWWNYVYSDFERLTIMNFMKTEHYTKRGLL